MAVKTVSASDYRNTGRAYLVGGAQHVYAVRKKIAIAAADDDTSKFLVAQIPSDAIIKSIRVRNTAITAGTSYGLGLYETVDNASTVIDATIFASAMDLSSAHAHGADLDGLSNLAITSDDQRVIELVNAKNSTNYSSGEKTMYDLVLTAATIGSAAGTVVVDVEYVNA